MLQCFEVQDVQVASRERSERLILKKAAHVPQDFTVQLLLDWSCPMSRQTVPVGDRAAKSLTSLGPGIWSCWKLDHPHLDRKMVRDTHPRSLMVGRKHRI